MEPDSLSLPWL